MVKFCKLAILLPACFARLENFCLNFESAAAHDPVIRSGSHVIQACKDYNAGVAVNPVAGGEEQWRAEGIPKQKEGKKKKMVFSYDFGKPKNLPCHKGQLELHIQSDKNMKNLKFSFPGTCHAQYYKPKVRWGSVGHVIFTREYEADRNDQMNLEIEGNIESTPKVTAIVSCPKVDRHQTVLDDIEKVVLQEIDRVVF